MKDLFWDGALDTINSASFLKADKNPEKRQRMHKLQSLKVCIRISFGESENVTKYP